jgi:hypothetical protein
MTASSTVLVRNLFILTAEYEVHPPEPTVGYPGGIHHLTLHCPLTGERELDIERLLDPRDWEIIHDQVYADRR